MGKTCRVKQRTNTSKKRKRFLGVRRQLVNTGINLLTLNNESKNDNLSIYMIWSKKVFVLGVIQQISILSKSNKMFSVSQTPSVSSSKVENIEEELPQRK